MWWHPYVESRNDDIGVKLSASLSTAINAHHQPAVAHGEIDEAAGGMDAIQMGPNERVSLANGFTTLEVEGRGRR